MENMPSHGAIVAQRVLNTYSMTLTSMYACAMHIENSCDLMTMAISSWKQFEKQQYLPMLRIIASIPSSNVLLQFVTHYDKCVDAVMDFAQYNKALSAELKSGLHKEFQPCIIDVKTCEDAFTSYRAETQRRLQNSELSKWAQWEARPSLEMERSAVSRLKSVYNRLDSEYSAAIEPSAYVRASSWCAIC